MKKYLKFLILAGMLLGVTAISANNFAFRSFRETKGVVTNSSKGVYVWGPWQQSSVNIVLDIPNNLITINDELEKKETRYSIQNKSDGWTVKRDYKYVNFECIEAETMSKYFLRLYEYDSGEFRFTVMSPTDAVRYSVIYETFAKKLHELNKIDSEEE